MIKRDHQRHLGNSEKCIKASGTKGPLDKGPKTSLLDSDSASGEVLTSTRIWMELPDGLERLRTRKGKNPFSKVVK